ncbi:MAG: GntR family transcriptional regulator [Alkaliphilus sp.]|nr:GntR family transcriptional regulator [bacterium AH-315-G05]PHS35924.1 MAG: GntR family transcriptional regulator [Alkaliphilus sp.]
MLLDSNSDKPVYAQLVEAIEDDILREIFKEDSKIISTTEMSVQLRINPGTALKAINLLADDEIIYKKRGVGMFVYKGAKKKIMNKRKKSFREIFVLPMMKEADKLKISKKEINEMMEGSKEV